jgi:hypothetical protein
MDKIGIYYFRSLYSQSACSLSVGKFSDFLINRGYKTNLHLLKNDNHIGMIEEHEDMLKNDIIIYKTNYKDFEYGIRLFENILTNSNKLFYLAGPFAIMNRERILKKYSFVKDVIDIQNSDEISKIFPSLGNIIKKNTIICGIDREIEKNEKGHYINLEASMGCIYNCAFCHIKLMNYAKIEKNIELVVDEIETLHRKLGKKYFIFNDSIFWKNDKDNQRIEQFVELLKKKKIPIYFMIYLSLTIKISDELLEKLRDVGLIRVFFGVENISNNFSVQNNKYISATDTEVFISKLEKLNIGYHIGFMLFSKETRYEELQENIDFLYKLKKLFRPGMLVEKMRILPNSKNSKYLYNDDTQIDQAYNYFIDDPKVERYYQILNQLFLNINIRNFEQFFSGIKIALTILKREKLIDSYNSYEREYYRILNVINDGVYNILSSELRNMEITKEEIKTIKDLYSIAEINYIKFMSYLKNNNKEIYETIPHGTEDLNVW